VSRDTDKNIVRISGREILSRTLVRISGHEILIRTLVRISVSPDIDKNSG
jgi:hypothetical protein